MGRLSALADVCETDAMTEGADHRRRVEHYHDSADLHELAFSNQIDVRPVIDELEELDMVSPGFVPKPPQLFQGEG